ncbi:MAG TPA: helix-turn-helix domain-containing protein [Acidimicrobiales bacterium]|nr:helix-turn-helix domain-containing protein [Acidimicrobiales bacterium]
MSSDPATTELKGQAQRGAKTRTAIIDAALDVFATRGYRSSALGEIATRVGLTPAAILYHFGSKEALLLAVIAERDRRAGDLLTDISLANGLESLRGLVRIAELNEQRPGLAALHTVLQAESFEPDTPAHTYFLERSRRVRGWIETGLREGQRRGTVRADLDCGAKARELIAFLEGAAVLWLIDREVSLVDLYSHYVEAFVADASP